jgi:hypothetical protein
LTQEADAGPFLATPGCAGIVRLGFGAGGLDSTLTVTVGVTLGAGVLEGAPLAPVVADEPHPLTTLTRTAASRLKPALPVTCRRRTPRRYASKTSEPWNEPLARERTLHEIGRPGCGLEAQRLAFVHRKQRIDRFRGNPRPELCHVSTGGLGTAPAGLSRTGHMLARHAGEQHGPAGQHPVSAMVRRAKIKEPGDRAALPIGRSRRGDLGRPAGWNRAIHLDPYAAGTNSARHSRCAVIGKRSNAESCRSS